MSIMIKKSQYSDFRVQKTAETWASNTQHYHEPIFEKRRLINIWKAEA